MARYMLLLASNAYIDREREIISSTAWQTDIARKWRGDQFVGHDVLRFGHKGQPIGDIIYSNLHGRFIVEIARERAGTIALSGEQVQIAAIWDMIAARDRDWGCSPGYHYFDLRDGVYHDMRKWESSVLPIERAANPYTYAGVFSDAKK